MTRSDPSVVQAGPPQAAATSAAARDAYDATKLAVAAGDEATRLALANRPDLAPELLFFLATDKVVGIRAAVAANAATPMQADRLLAADSEAAVRAVVGRKLAPRAPELAAAEDRLRGMAYRTLCALTADTAVMVRMVIAEELATLPDAPRALILQLANDAAMEVAGPVIRFSPQLTEDDLLALVAAPPIPETAVAVARRPRLSERLSDAIAEQAHEAAVAALLDNGSAAIREQTLDRLVSQAAGKIRWQESLVRRPLLPQRAARALAHIVADHLLEPLAARPDLDRGVAEALRERVNRRLQATGGQPVAEPPAPQTAFDEAGRRGDRLAMIRHLAEAAQVPPAIVERAARLRSPKALVSLCWKAGFGLHCLALAQIVLGQLPPAAVLPPQPDGWPLSEPEMNWQIELLQEPEVAPR